MTQLHFRQIVEANDNALEAELLLVDLERIAARLRAIPLTDMDRQYRDQIIEQLKEV